MDAMQELLLARLAGDPAPAAPALPELLLQAVGDDPAAAPVLDALRRRQERLAAADDVAAAESGPREGPDAAPDAMVAEVLERLYAEVEGLRERNQVLADALGACPRCWGEDRSCRTCRGRGQPGGRLPDAALFAAIVQPAVRRARLPGAARHTGPVAQPGHAATVTTSSSPVELRPEPAY